MTVNRTVSNTVVYETPENINLVLQLAGPVPRALAIVVDTFIRYTALFIVFLLSPKTTFFYGVMLVIWFLTGWFYPVFFEVNTGTTPGKRLMKLAVVNADGTQLRFRASVIRNFLRTVDLLPFGYVLGLISMLLNRRFQRLGDIAANSMVVYRFMQADLLDSRQIKTNQPIAETGNDLQPMPVSASLKTHEQLAVIAYGERYDGLSASRRRELAAIIQPALSTNQDGTPAEIRLLQHAAWYRGHDMIAN